MILDTACRLGEYGEALALRARYHFRDRDVDALLRALMRDDFVAFWRVRRRLDGYAASLAGWADEGVRRHALKCVGKAYLNVDRRFLERVAGGRGWGDLVAMDGVGWELVSDKDCDGEEGQVVVVRRVKGGKR